MHNFHPTRQGEYMYRTGDEGEVVEVRVYHAAGGRNWFNGGVEPRGVYVSITPKELERTETGFSVARQLLGSGIKFFAVETTRKSPKKIKQVAELLDPHVAELAGRWRAEEQMTNVKMHDLVQKIGAEVG